MLEDGSQVFAAADFGFTDTDGDSLAGVKITAPPAAGQLRLDGAAVAPPSADVTGAVQLAGSARIRRP
jgi:hypothetical protein